MNQQKSTLIARACYELFGGRAAPETGRLQNGARLQASIERLSLFGNGGGGAISFGGLISDSVSELNGGTGITGLDITVQGILSRDNALFGLEAYGHSSYENSRFSGNNNYGAQVNKKPAQGGGNLCNATTCP